MTRRMEHEVVRTLESAAGRAPTPQPDLLDQLARRRRVVRRRSQVVVSAAAVLAVVAGSAVTYGALGQSGQSATLTPAAQPAGGAAKAEPDKLATEPIEKLWPAAVHNVPGRLPNGQKFHPQTMVDDHTVLVSVDAGFEDAGALWLYDLQDRTARKVTTVRTPKDARIFATNFTVGGGQVVWWIARPYHGTTAVELWGAPLAGGEPHLVARVEGKTGVEGLIAINGAAVRWSTSGGGVYQAPVSGGEAELIEGTEKSALVDWSWAGTPVWPSAGKTEARVVPATPPDEITYRTLRNLDTGEERVATERDGEWLCQVRWCVGRTEDGGAVQRRDGTGRREVGGDLLMMGPTNQFARDRFLFVSESIYDVETHQAGRVAASEGGGFRLMHDGRLYYVETKDGYQLVDMAAIAASDPPR